jgi:hypothetical protein
MNSKKYIHFGCWNNLNKKSCLTKVMTKLKEYLGVYGTPEFMVIAGDNYYPDKSSIQNLDKDNNPIIGEDGKPTKTKTKIIKQTFLRDGFDLLPDIPINMILGNHDLETNTKKKNLFIETDTVPEGKDCFIIQKEIEAIKPNVDFNLFKFQRVNSTTLWLMIDTSMYSDDINKYLTCYNTFFRKKGLSTFSNEQDLVNFQNNQIIQAITDNMDGLKHIIISGHHPIIGVKYDSDPDDFNKPNPEILNDIPDFKPILKQICELTNNHLKYYYLCADLHLYQKGLIQLTCDNGNIMEITQYVVGTGGTKLDDALPESILMDTIFEDDGIKYILQDCRQKCGFLECSIKDDGVPLFRFMDADEPISVKTPSLPSSVNSSIVGKSTTKRAKSTTKRPKSTTKRAKSTTKRYQSYKQKTTHKKTTRTHTHTKR